MGDVFLVLTDDDKQGTINPQVIGPFASIDEAEEFQTLDPQWDDGAGIRVPVDGGYAGSSIIAAEYAEDPSKVREQWTELDY